MDIRAKGLWVLCVFVAAALYLLLSEHQAHALPYLPYLILIACPLMHLFMHGGHHGHHHEARKDVTQGKQNE